MRKENGNVSAIFPILPASYILFIMNSNEGREKSNDLSRVRIAMRRKSRRSVAGIIMIGGAHKVNRKGLIKLTTEDFRMDQVNWTVTPIFSNITDIQY